MTHKTGNFKRFSVFASMLRTVLTQPTDALSLDLMSYSDLEQLRHSRAGTVRSRATSGSSSRNTKRYLILSYTAAFDKIHYPLPLCQQAMLDPLQLKDALRRARAELRSRGSVPSVDELRQLRKENERLVAENARLTQLAHQQQSSADLRKELVALKTVVRDLEEQLLQERSRGQRAAQRRSRDTRQLQQDLEQSRAAERALKARVRNLTQELALFRQRPVSRGSPRALGRTSRESSCGASSSRENSPVRPRFDPTAWVREQQNRRQERRAHGTRHWSPAASVRSAPIEPLPSGTPRSRANSSTGSSVCGSSASRVRPHSAGAGRCTRRPPLSDCAPNEDGVEGRGRPARRRYVASKGVRKENLRQHDQALLKEEVLPKATKQRRGKFNVDKENADRVPSDEINEIDERLNRLQDFLRRHLPLP